MTGPTWEMAEHTAGKHMVLRSYLDAWLPIMGFTQRKIVFIDGFAGPGAYSSGEDGSPIVALKAYRDHPHRSRFRADAFFYFIEKDSDCLEHLRQTVEPIAREIAPKGKVVFRQGEFDATISAELTGIRSQGYALAPAFVMVDPFGVSQTPMAVLGQILAHPQSELYVSFMWEWINRFKGTSEFAPHLDALFGTPDWREAFRLPRREDQRAALFALYERSLRAAGARHVLRFDLYKGNRLVYAIFFATKSPKGCDKMKEAMWKVDPLGGFSFVPGRDGGFFRLLGPDTSMLKRQLRQEFGSTNEWVDVDAVEDWIMTDATYFYSRHLRDTLKEMEREGNVQVHRLPGKKKGSFTSGTTLSFQPWTVV